MTTNPGPKPAVPIGDRWAADEKMLAADPLTVDAEPRWIADDLPQYAPTAAPQPTFDDLDGDQL